MKKQIAKQIVEEQEEMRRAREERDGLAVLRNQEKQEKSVETKSERNSNMVHQLGGPDLVDPKFSLSDFTIFLRWYIETLHKVQDVQLFLKKVQSVIQTDRLEFLDDYLTLKSLAPGEEVELEYYDGLNGYIASLPLNPPKIDDFFVEYDTLVHHFGIETTIGHEDGRPFAYEVDHKFMDQVYSQAVEFTFVPYEGILTSDETTEPTKNNLGGFNGSLGLDSSINTLAAISGMTSKLQKGLMSKLKACDWTTVLNPNFDSISLQNRQKVEALVETDMELKLEYDVLLLSDHEPIQSHLKESAKRMWERAASVPNCRPLMAKVSIIPQNRELKSDLDGEIRYPKLFDFGFQIPTPDFTNRTEHILNEKKIAYGVIIKTNEDTRKLELEILNADPSKTFDKSNYITPTIASIFAEHEVLGYQQLRFIKTRELRLKVLRQLNYFRSIEKRISMQLQDTKSDIAVGALADMFEKLEFFEINTKQTKEWPEDIRTVQNDKIYITDRKGISIVYGNFE
jgi:hypothetical protein